MPALVINAPNPYFQMKEVRRSRYYEYKK